MYYFGIKVVEFVVHPQKYSKWLRQMTYAPTVERLDEVIERLLIRFVQKIEELDPRGAAEYVRQFHSHCYSYKNIWILFQTQLDELHEFRRFFIERENAGDTFTSEMAYFWNYKVSNQSYWLYTLYNSLLIRRDRILKNRSHVMSYQ